MCDKLFIKIKCKGTSVLLFQILNWQIFVSNVSNQEENENYNKINLNEW